MSDKKFNNRNLREAIDKSRMTREQIADKVQCDTSSITKYYNGDRYPKTDVIIKLAKLFNVSTDYLLGVTDVATTDKDLRFVCDYTGLKEKTVINLNFVKRDFNEQDNEYKDDIYDLLNNLVVHSLYQLSKNQSLLNLYCFTCLLKKEIKETDYNALECANILLNSYLYSAEQDYQELIYDLFEIKEAKAEINKILDQSPKRLEEIEEERKELLEALNCKDIDELKVKLGLN